MDFYERLEQDLKECDAFITGGDDEIWSGVAMKGYGGRLIVHELLSPLHLKSPIHWNHALRGVLNYPRVIDAAKESHTGGLELFFDVVGKTHCADRDFAYNATKEYIGKHEFEGAKEFIGYLREIGDVFIVTLGSQIAADAAVERYGLAGGMGNPVAYYEPRNDSEKKNPIIKGCEIKINENSKLEAVQNMLEEKGYSLNNCGVIGSGRMDWPFIGKVKLFMASPGADHITKERAKYWIDNYKEAAEGLPKIRRIA